MTLNARLHKMAFGPGSIFELLSHSAALHTLVYEIETSVITGRVFDAFAEQSELEDRIAIYTGVLEKIKSTIAELGDTVKSVRKNSSLKQEMWWEEISDTSFQSRLILFCLDYLILHEVSHISLNHCLVANSGGPFRLHELGNNSVVNPNQDNEISCALRHALEATADALASRIAISVTKRFRHQVERFWFQNAAGAEMGYIWASQIIWAIMAESCNDFETDQINYLRAQEAKVHKSHALYSHPHPSIRRIIANEHLGKHASSGFSAFGRGFLLADAKVMVDEYLTRKYPPKKKGSPGILSRLAFRKHLSRFKLAYNSEWGKVNARLLPKSRWQSCSFVNNALEKYGWNRELIIRHGQGSDFRVVEFIASLDTPSFMATNKGQSLPIKDFALI